MADISVVTESERDIYRMYERERRLRILRYANPAMIGILLLILLALLIPRTQTSDEAIIANSFTSLSTLLASGHREIGIIFLVMNVVSIALFVAGYLFAQRGHVSTSATLAT